MTMDNFTKWIGHRTWARSSERPSSREERESRTSDAAAADAEWNPQENGKPSSTEYIGMRSLHQREGPEKKEKKKNGKIKIRTVQSKN